jgi:hypothetical protein
MTAQMIVRIDPKKREQLTRLSRAEGKATSELVRELIDNFIREHDIGGYIDDLWQRTGDIMTKKGRSEKDIARVIKESRKGMRASHR